MILQSSLNALLRLVGLSKGEQHPNKPKFVGMLKEIVRITNDVFVLGRSIRDFNILF